MARNGRVLVVGGGVGGLCHALGLVRRGVSATVLEADQQHTLQAPSSYIGLWSPSLDILHSHGILDGIELQYVAATSYRSVDGAVLASPSLRLDAPPMSGQPALAFLDEAALKAKLVETLESESRQGSQHGGGDEGEGRVLFGKRVKAVSPEGVLCEDGSRFDPPGLLVAADGSHSRCLSLDSGNLS